MKGIIFTNFMTMVDEVFSPEVTEEILDKVDLESGAAYTSVGVYDHSEILSLVVALSETTKVPVPDLVRAFGKYLFGALGQAHPEYIEGVSDTFELLQKVHGHIHVEVRKLYPDAELPEIGCTVGEDDTLTVAYASKRPFADVAHGLIAGCIDHFGDPITMTKCTKSDDGCEAVFELKRAA